MEPLRLPDWRRLLTPPLPSWLPPTPGSWDNSLAQARAQIAQAQRAALLAAAPATIDSGHRISASLRDSWFILGMRGTGKTTFTKRLLREYRRLYPGARTYVLDTKQSEEDGLGRWPGLVTSDNAPPVLRTPGAVQVWQPGTDEVEPIGEWLRGIFQARQPSIVYIDELSSLSEREGGAFYPMAFKRILKQGRSLGIALIALTQEAAYLPRQLKTQSSQFVRFGLQADPHGKRLAAELLGHDEPREPREKYGFFYRNVGRELGPAWEYGSFREFF